jgi:hypothetical protein
MSFAYNRICYIASWSCVGVHPHGTHIEGQSLEKGVGKWYSDNGQDLRRESENASNNACKLNLPFICAKMLEWVGMVSLYDSRGEFV